LSVETVVAQFEAMVGRRTAAYTIDGKRIPSMLYPTTVPPPEY
jgi:hypothetical protein